MPFGAIIYQGRAVGYGNIACGARADCGGRAVMRRDYNGTVKLRPFPRGAVIGFESARAKYTG